MRLDHALLIPVLHPLLFTLAMMSLHSFKTAGVFVRGQCVCNTPVVRAALKQFYDATGGPQWTFSNRWLGETDTVCSWYGFLECERLVLPSNNLRGTLPSALSVLVNLTKLDVKNNFLSGSLPPEYSTWTRLNFLFANGNSFSGTLPQSYRSWRFLETFDVYDNAFTGSLPPEYSAWRRLEIFAVQNNVELSGTLPSEYRNLTALTYFDVTNTSITGTLPPEYGNWTALVVFKVFNTKVYGTLPSQYRAWSKVANFSVNNNSISGTLPPEYGEWGSSIEGFGASNNLLSGSIPPEYRNWTNLFAFLVSVNYLNGTLPPELSSWTRLTTFLVAFNRLEGTLPPQYRTWSGLKNFLMASNRITGTLPPEYSDWSNFGVFTFASNNLSGTLPASWVGKVHLFLMLYDNPLLSGTIPAGMSTPFYVSLCNTSVCGNVPTAWAATQWLCQSFTVSQYLALYTGDFSSLQVVTPGLRPCPTPTPPPPPSSVVPSNATRSLLPLPVAQAVASGMTTAALSVNAIAPLVVSAASSDGSSTTRGSFVQVSGLSARVSARLRDCDTPSPSGLRPALDEVGSFVADNPTTLALPGRLSSSGGAVVGNALLLFAAPPVAAGVYYAVRKVITAARGDGEHVGGGGAIHSLLLGLAARLHLVVYAWVLVPTAAAAAVLLADGVHGGGGGAAALGVFGLVVVVAPSAVIAVAHVQSRPLKGKVFSAARSQRRWSFSLRELARRLCADRGSWSLQSTGRATSRGRPKAAPGAVSQLLQHALCETLHGFVFPHGHMFAVDFALAVAQGLVAGLALSPAAAPSCAAVRGLLWSIFAVSVCAAVFEAWVRPRATLLDEGITLVMAVWTAVVSLLSALDIEDAASDAAAAQAVLSLCCVVLQLVVNGVRSLPSRRNRTDPSMDPRAGVTATDAVQVASRPSSSYKAAQQRRLSAPTTRLDGFLLRRGTEQLPGAVLELDALKELVEQICVSRRQGHTISRD